MTLWTTPLYPLAAVGLCALALGGALAVPLDAPPPLASIGEGASKLDLAGAPEMTRFQARDGTWLAYRLYPAADGSTGHAALLLHGSTGNALEMNGMAKALAGANVTAVALDMRGHGASGTRGDIAYAGQIVDDLADLLDHLGAGRRYDLIGFSLGGGFVARIAGTPLGRRFERLVALAPFLGPRAPTNRPNQGAGRWAEIDRPRVVALALLQSLGIEAGQSLPVIHYATAPDAQMRQTPVYSYRLLAGYGPAYDWSATQAGLSAAAPRVRVLVGADDPLMDAPAMARELRPLGTQVTVLPGIDHIGMVREPAALAAVVAAVN